MATVAPAASPPDKVVVVGESGVGKTSLTQNGADGTRAIGEHNSTMGVDCRVVHLSEGRRLQVWDTAGQERFRCITRSYYHNAVAALVVFDLSNPSTRQTVPTWVEAVRMHTPDDVRIAVVGNKADQRAMQATEVHLRLSDMGLGDVRYFETSAATSDGVRRVFEWLPRPRRSAPTSDTVRLLMVEDEEPKSGSCC